MNPKVSIIIPCKGIGTHALESIDHCLKLDYPNYEIVVLPDFEEGTPPQDITVIPTGAVGPSEKRDLAAKHVDGEILAFLDDDAFPRKDWLRNAVRHFEREDVGAVGGPAVTPSNDGIMEQASGAVYSSLLGGGPYAYRYIPGKEREVDDYPTCNLLVRKSVFEQAGGFDTNFWPGEDTKLCLQITKDLEKLIIYEPGAVVYHHRRKLFMPHLKQIAAYALHRGYFAKKFPQTSLRLSYLLPSLLTLWLVAGLGALFFPVAREVYLASLGLYLLLVLASSMMASSFRLTPLVGCGILATHFVYGLWFLKGLTTRTLAR